MVGDQLMSDLVPEAIVLRLKYQTLPEPAPLAD